MAVTSKNIVKDIVNDLCQVEDVRQITAFDREAISEFLLSQEDTTSHGNHWIYYLTACRRLWLSYFDGDTLIPITTRFPGKPPFVIVRPVGLDVPNKCAALAAHLKDLSKQRVIVKNIDVTVRNSLRQLGFSDYRPGDGWSPSYRCDDQTFPEAVVDLNELVALNGDSYAHLRHDLRKGISNRLKLEPYNPHHHAADIGELIAKWEQAFLKRYPKEDVSDLLDFYTAFATGHEGLEFAKDYVGWVCRLDGQTVGFVYGAPKPNQAVDMYANPCWHKQSCLSESVLFSALRELTTLGFTTANLGGSETLGLHQFKHKFSPAAEIQRYHVVDYGGND
jgi:hypothetical protein